MKYKNIEIVELNGNNETINNFSLALQLTADYSAMTVVYGCFYGM